ncbi:cytochrome c maturation protein CcmE [Limnochorda pilosa]|uniref:Cytochrome C biogenesis protein CcmE n=1 Tax=Limnochorda pilosa TaxID=1555112 RepID=A0A0K2SJJ7_LIMPI|nr:cytochrome c maturation protein CcmE [Limnochorda pilosa]BAS27265.1 hypothetical protein LIP_1414 [Limnochorda pilosa]
MSRKVKLGVAGVLFGGVLAYLIATAVANTGVYYYTVAEAAARSSELSGRFLRVNGEVAPGSIQWDPTVMRLAFEVQEGASRIPAVYHGAKPDTFQGGAPVIVEGRWGPDGTITADQILMQCPSRYEPALPES